MDQIDFINMRDGTAEEYAFLHEQATAYNQAHLVDHILGQLKMMAGPKLGYKIDRYQHSLQSATRALRDGAEEEMVVAALLHDIKRKEKKHAEKGADLIKNLGFDKVAEIVRRHMDIDVKPDSNLDEKEIVYFADKLCNGKGVDLNYHQRFAHALKKSPWALTSISKRYEHTKQIHARIERSAGKVVDKILSA